VSEESHEEYARLLESSQAETSALEAAELRYSQASHEYHNSRGFLGFSCGRQCQQHKARVDKYDRQVNGRCENHEN